MNSSASERKRTSWKSVLFTLQWGNVTTNYTNNKLAQKIFKQFSLPFLGLLAYTEAIKWRNENLIYLFITDRKGRDVFRCTMFKRKFEIYRSALRFCGSSTTGETKNDDLATVISDLFQAFIKTCIAFRGRCHFKAYIPNKRAKYDLADARNLFNAYIYSG